MRVEIIVIGDEILIGQIIDTNSNWIAQQLTNHGFEIVQINTVPDKKDIIKTSIDLALEHADAIIITGGLGPTSDDITKKTLAEYFKTDLILNTEVLEDVRSFIESRGVAFTKNHHLQAMVPAHCTILKNTSGTAPGMWFEKNKKIIVSLPGVPLEMKSIMNQSVIPKLAAMNQNSIFKYTIMTIGYTESALVELLEKWESELPTGIKIAYLPSPGQVRLRVSKSGSNAEAIEADVMNEVGKLKKIISERNIFGYNDQSIQEAVQDIFVDKKLTFSSAESCTGGYIAHLLTSVPGCSGYFKGSVTAYSNEIKQNILKVKEETLIAYGAVSKQTVEEMAVNVRTIFNTDISVAVSGIAGPGGASSDKPVGTIWIAVADSQSVYSKQFQFGKIRERNIIFGAINALNMARLKALDTKTTE